jgi:hypothetical protein
MELKRKRDIQSIAEEERLRNPNANKRKRRL